MDEGRDVEEERRIWWEVWGGPVRALLGSWHTSHSETSLPSPGSPYTNHKVIYRLGASQRTDCCVWCYDLPLRYVRERPLGPPTYFWRWDLLISFPGNEHWFFLLVWCCSSVSSRLMLRCVADNRAAALRRCLDWKHRISMSITFGFLLQFMTYVHFSSLICIYKVRKCSLLAAFNVSFFCILHWVC